MLSSTANLLFLGMGKGWYTGDKEGEEKTKGVHFPTDSHSVMHSCDCFLEEKACAYIAHVRLPLPQTNGKHLCPLIFAPMALLTAQKWWNKYVPTTHSSFINASVTISFLQGHFTIVVLNRLSFLLSTSYQHNLYSAIIKKSHQILLPVTSHHVLTHVFSWQQSFYSACLSMVSRVIRAAFQNLGFSHIPCNFLAHGFTEIHLTHVCILSLPLAAYSTLWKKWNKSSTWHLYSICIPTKN